MRALIIIPVPSVHDAPFKSMNELPITTKTCMEASLVIVQDKTHFRCIKNRWANTYEFENIPNMFLRAYLSQYELHLSAGDILNAWMGESRV